MNTILSLGQNLVHPLHTNLNYPPPDSSGTSGPLHIIGQLISDPYFTSSEFLRRFHRGSSHRSSSDGHQESLVAPDFDVRESEGYFFLEGEFPGVSEKGDIKIQWVGHRTLVIEAEVQKVDEEREWGLNFGRSHISREDNVELNIEAGQKNRDREDEPREQHQHGHGHGDWRNVKEGKERERERERERDGGFRVWLNERHTGALHRSFTFPHDVDPDRMRARLNHGLLKILVPKVRKEYQEPSKRVYIED